MNKAAIAAALRAKNSAKDDGAPLRDVYSYFDLFGDMRDATDPGMAHGGESGMGSTGVGLDWADAGNQAENQNADPVRFNAPPALAGAVTRNRMGNNEGGDSWRFSVDPTKLPETRFGGVLNSHRVDPTTRLRNPAMVYDDPNYGRITDARNINTESWSDYFGPAIMAAATAGMGALGAPTLATGLIGAARGVGEGGLRGGAGGIAGILGNLAGLPSWATGLGRIALSNALRRKKG